MSKWTIVNFEELKQGDIINVHSCIVSDKITLANESEYENYYAVDLCSLDFCKNDIMLILSIEKAVRFNNLIKRKLLCLGTRNGAVDLYLMIHTLYIDSLPMTQYRYPILRRT